MAKLTAKQLSDYYADRTHCPKCGSGNLNGGSVNSDSSEAWQHLDCEDCGFEWLDIYTFYRIEDVRGEPFTEEGTDG